MTTIGIVLEPLDVLFFRDGRSFGAASRVTSGLPTPQVLAGAVRTALLEKHGCSFKRLGESLKASDGNFGKAIADAFPQHQWIGQVKVRGPWLHTPVEAKKAEAIEAAHKVSPGLFVPVPANICAPKKGEKGLAHRANPLAATLPGWKAPEGLAQLRPLWLPSAQAVEPFTGFVSMLGLKTYLCDGNGLPDRRCQLFSPDTFYKFDHRTGNEISGARLTTEEGQLYGISFLATKPGVCFYAEVVVPDEHQAAVDDIRFLAFGGEGKRVLVKKRDKPLLWPKIEQTTSKKLVLLTTPVVTDTLGIPSPFRDKLVAAAVNSPIAISGWDLAKGGPKPTRFAAPAGSVYFLESNDPIPDLSDELGFGCFLEGVWTDAQ